MIHNGTQNVSSPVNFPPGSRERQKPAKDKLI